MHNNANIAALWYSFKRLDTHIFKIMISFLAAFLTFLPSFLWNFLQVYILRVFLSFARKISQNSSLRKKTSFSRPHHKHLAVFLFCISCQHHNIGVLTIWQSVPDHTCQSPRRDCYNPSSHRESGNRMAWQQGASCHNTTCNTVHSTKSKPASRTWGLVGFFLIICDSAGYKQSAHGVLISQNVTSVYLVRLWLCYEMASSIQ